MSGDGRRRRRKALDRQNRGYPGALGGSVPVVGDEDWVSQFDAAERLGVGLGRIGLLIQGGRLNAVHDQRGRAGVDRPSVEREANKRAGASTLRRAWLLFADVGRGFARGI